MRRVLFLPIVGFAMLAGVPAGGTQSTGEQPGGAQLFELRCAACHDDRGFGTRILARRVPEDQAELEARENLTAPFVSAVVRNGLGSMPPIRAAELSDEELALIAAHLAGDE